VHKIKNVPGYTTPVFKEKEEQRAKVQATVAGKVCTIFLMPVVATSEIVAGEALPYPPIVSGQERDHLPALFSRDSSLESSSRTK